MSDRTRCLLRLDYTDIKGGVMKSILSEDKCYTSFQYDIITLWNMATLLTDII